MIFTCALSVDRAPTVVGSLATVSMFSLVIGDSVDSGVDIKKNYPIKRLRHLGLAVDFLALVPFIQSIHPPVLVGLFYFFAVTLELMKT